MIDKRKYVRIPDQIEIRFQIISLGQDPIAHLTLSGDGHSENISEGGILVEVGEPVPVGTFLEVQLNAPDLKDPICLKGKVTHLEEAAGHSRYELGIRFTHFFEKDRELLTKHLKDVAGILFGS